MHMTLTEMQTSLRNPTVIIHVSLVKIVSLVLQLSNHHFQCTCESYTPLLLMMLPMNYKSKNIGLRTFL